MFEAIGRPSTVELAIASLPVGGTAVLVGMTPIGERAGFEVFPFVDGAGGSSARTTARQSPRSTSRGMRRGRSTVVFRSTG